MQTKTCTEYAQKAFTEDRGLLTVKNGKALARTRTETATTGLEDDRPENIV
jgi:hypothetical protein